MLNRETFRWLGLLLVAAMVAPTLLTAQQSAGGQGAAPTAPSATAPAIQPPAPSPAMQSPWITPAPVLPPTVALSSNIPQPTAPQTPPAPAPPALSNVPANAAVADGRVRLAQSTTPVYGNSYSPFQTSAIPAAPAMPSALIAEARVAQLEARVAELEARLNELTARCSAPASPSSSNTIRPVTAKPRN